MNTNLELSKSVDVRNCLFMTNSDVSKLIEYATLEAGNKVIFDNLVNALKAEFVNNQLSKPITNTVANLDILLVVDDNDLTDTMDLDSIDFENMTQTTQDAMTAFINMANGL